MWQYRGQKRPPFAEPPAAGQESVWDYPRPPGLEPCNRSVEVSSNDTVIARTSHCYRVLETASPPSFYLSSKDVDWRQLVKAPGSSLCEWKGTPFEKLYTFDAHTLLLGVGFDRCTSLHHAESLVSARRTTIHRYPVLEGGERVWVENLDMANDDGVHFPIVGSQFFERGSVSSGRVGNADALLFSTRELVDFAEAYFTRALN